MANISDRDLVLLLGIFILLLFFSGFGMMGMMGFGYMGWGFGWLIGLIFLIFVIWLFYSLFIKEKKLFISEEKKPKEEDHALTILRERYAKGEITKEQYLEMKKELEK